MKRLSYLLVALLTLSVGINQAIAQETQDQGQMSAKEIKKAKKEAKKKFYAAQEQIAYEKGVQAVKDQSFVVEVDQLTSPRGMVQYVSAITNFIYINDNNAVVQIATSNFNPGPNGVGGITVEGAPSNIKMTTDKKGVINYSFSVQGIAISARVTMFIVPGTNRVNLTIYPNFNNNELTMSGVLVPYDQSTIFQGQTI